MRNILLLLLFTLIYLALSINVQSQQSFLQYDKNVNYPQVESPNAASFNKHVDHPISLYTGAPDVTIPLYTLTDGMVKIPLTLRYNTTGIKVSEEASWVGLGWNLNIGGVITQNVVGIHDDFTSSYYNDIVKALGMNNSSGYTQWNFYNPVWGDPLRNAFHWYFPENSSIGIPKEGRATPDVYYYSYPGGSGKYIIDNRNDNVNLLKREENIKITFKRGRINNLPLISQYSINQFSIITNEGIEHIFDYFGYSANQGPGLSDPISTTFILVESKYPNGQIVKYEYEKCPFNKLCYSESYQCNVDNNIYPLVNPHENYVKNRYEYIGWEFYLKKIKTTNYTIDFSLKDRNDLEQGKHLSSITISPIVNNGNNHKSFKFNYEYFVSSLTQDGWGKFNNLWPQNLATSRLKLKSVYETENVEVDQTSFEKGKYEFFYEESHPLPRKDSYSVDYWGLYNGALNSSLIPNLDNFKNDYWTQKIKYDYYGTGIKANRSYNFDYAKAGILTGIQYPTKGFLKFIYEPNKFYGFPIPTTEELIKDGSPYVQKKNFKQVIDRNGDSDNKYEMFFIDEDNVTIEIEMELSQGVAGFSNSSSKTKNSWPELAQAKASFWTWDKDTTHFSIAQECWDRFYDEQNGSIKYPLSDYEKTYGVKIVRSKKMNVNKGYYFMKVEFPDQLGVQNNVNLNMGYIKINVNYFSSSNIIEKECTGAGIRIKEIHSYDSKEASKQILSSKYIYAKTHAGTTSGVLLNPLCFTNYYDKNVTYLYKTVEGTPTPTHYTATHTHVIGEISSNNLINNPYESMADVGYTYVIEEKVVNIKNNGFIIHEFHNVEPQHINGGTIKLDDPLNGKQLSISTYDGNGNLEKLQKNQYECVVSNYYFGCNYFDKVNMFPGMYSRTDFNLKTLQNGVSQSENTVGISEVERLNPTWSRLSLIMYPLNTYDITMKKTETILDGVNTQEEFIYNFNTLQLKEKKTVSSEGGILKFCYSYPNDFNCGIYSTMTSKNIISNIVEEKIFRNNGSITFCVGKIKTAILSEKNISL